MSADSFPEIHEKVPSWEEHPMLVTDSLAQKLLLNRSEAGSPTSVHLKKQVNALLGEVVPDLQYEPSIDRYLVTGDHLRGIMARSVIRGFGQTVIDSISKSDEITQLEESFDLLHAEEQKARVKFCHQTIEAAEYKILSGETDNLELLLNSVNEIAYTLNNMTERRHIALNVAELMGKLHMMSDSDN